MNHYPSGSMKTGALLPVLFALSACASHTWYKDAESFRADLSSWPIQGKQVGDAIAVLESKGFTCVRTGKTDLPYQCDRQTGGFLCVQKHTVSLDVAQDATVRAVSPHLSRDGALPTTCL